MNDPDASRDDRFDEVVAEFLEAVEAGESPDQREFAARHPEFERSLLEFFDDYQRMGGLLAPEHPDNEPMDPCEAPTHVGKDHVASTAPHSKRATSASPATLGDFELLEKIAEGGMGVVYKAKQKGLNRVVALKMIRSGQLADDEEVQRFHREAAAAGKLDHPGIVPIYQVGEDEGQHFFAMAYVRGQSLAEIIREQRLAPRRAAEYVRKVALAVQFAHRHGIIHRDIKPGNVLVDEHDEPKVTDFGLAKEVDSEHSLTTSGQIVGTISYMPPEQASGTLSRVSTWSDVYSLGALLYALLTQQPPFQAANPLDVLVKVLSDSPVPPSKVGFEKWKWFQRQDESSDSGSSSWRGSKIPLDLDTICLKCLEKEPAKRYASAEALADDLQRFLDGEPIEARRVRLVERTVRWCQRRKALSAAIALAASIAVVTPFIVAKGRGLSEDLQDQQDQLAKAQLLGSATKTDQRVSPWEIALFQSAAKHYEAHPLQAPTENPRAHSLCLATQAMVLSAVDAPRYASKVQELITVLEERSALAPDDVSIQSALADCHQCAGIQLWRGNPTEAYHHLSEAHRILKALSAAAPANEHLRERVAGVELELSYVAPGDDAKQLLLSMEPTKNRDLQGVIRFDLQPVADPIPQIVDRDLERLRDEAATHRGDQARQLALAEGLNDVGETEQALIYYDLAFTLFEVQRGSLVEHDADQVRQFADGYRRAAGALSQNRDRRDEAIRWALHGIALRLAVASSDLEKVRMVPNVRVDFAHLAMLLRERLPSEPPDDETFGPDIWPDHPEVAYHALLTLRSQLGQ